MNCGECGSPGATEVAVEFTDGVEREIPFCGECQNDCRDGDFVQDVANE